MGRNVNKDSEVAAPTPERRSLRHSKPSEDEVKASPPVKGRRSVGKKKEEKPESKDEDDVQEASEDNHNDSSILSSGEGEPETSNSKPVSPKNTRGTRKRPASEEADVEEIEEEREDKDKKSEKDSSEMKNGQADRVGKGKPKKKRKPPTKKKKQEQDEAEMWTPLEPLEGDEKKDAQKKTQSKSDRRKQALVERQAPAEPMLQKQLPRQRRNSGASECEVLDSAPHSHRRSKTIVTVDIDDDLSETGSIQIVAEPDVDSVFDFKRLLIQYRNVNLPSSLWGVHKDPRNQFVSFTRFNPDYPDTNGIFADRAVVFKSSLNPDVFINGMKIELPEMFTVVETLYETSQVIQFANNTVSPIGHAQEETVDGTS